MKLFFIFLFFIILFSLHFASANINPSTGKLFFDFQKMEKQCQMIEIKSSDYAGKVNVRDIWSPNSESKNSKEFLISSAQLNLDISYTREINNFKDKENIEVCITPSQTGIARGLIIFTPESTTNVIVETGVWLFVNVSGSSSYMKYQLDEIQNKTLEQLPEQKSPITGAVIGSNLIGMNSLIIGMIFIILILALIIIILYFKRGKKQEWEKF